MTAPSQIDFLSPLQKIPGLGPKRLFALNAVGIKTVGELLGYYPARYLDRSNRINISEARNFLDSVITVRGTVEKARAEYFGRGRYRISVRDGTGEIEAVWYIRSMKIEAGATVMLTGKVSGGPKGRLFMFHPAFEKIASGCDSIKLILPVYSIKEPMRDAGVNQSLMRKTMEWALSKVEHYPQMLPATIENKYGFEPFSDCIRNVHFPEDLSALDKYKSRLKYEELYKLALNLRWNKRKFALPGYAMEPGELDAKMRELLPYKLTVSQEEAVSRLYADAAKRHRMHRLLQGDVGSGKTITALMATLPALNSGRQVIWMAPTEILAKQTKAVVDKYICALGFKTGYLGAGDTPEKRETLRELATGELRFAVGTHALFMPSVKLCNPGMVVIDEQHKFGAAQRLKLQEKAPASDFLMMSATPIPQTLAKTLYGDLDIIDIAARPDRMPISTHIVPPSKRAGMEKFILEQIENGMRVFYVVPRIDQQGDDDDDDGSNGNDESPRKGVAGQPPAPAARPQIKTVDTVAAKLKTGLLSSVPIHKLHGQMSYEEREKAISAFKNGPPGILVATVIIEVGVDIPDATVMAIENPEFFGLAQLHQIRGRVGRGGAKSYCFLLPDADVEKSGKQVTDDRLKFLCGSQDGFEIAEWDLRRRGPGDVTGYKQSGWDDLCMADILEDTGMFREILKDIDKLFEKA